MLTLLQLAPRGVRVLGMGSGLFAMIFLGIIALFSILIGRCQKTGSLRAGLVCGVPLVILGIPLAILLLSPRADPYDTIKQEQEYNETYFPRIFIGIFQILFFIAAIISYMVTHGCKGKNALRVENDVETFDPAIHQ